MAKIAIIIYSTYGHIIQLAKKELEGAKEAGADVELFQIPETLPDEVLQQIYAPPKPQDIPIITLEDLERFDGFIFGLPTRYGSFPAQFKAFWDQTGGLWGQGKLHGKYVAQFVSTAGLGGGQEVTIRNTLSAFAHHGLIYVPLGYKNTFGQLTNLTEVHGGSPWGAGTLAGADGSRQPSDLELEVATIQGKVFAETVIRATSQQPSVASSVKTAVASSSASKSQAAKPQAAAPATSAAPAAAPAAPAVAARAAQSTPAVSEKKKSSFCGICVVM